MGCVSFPRRARVAASETAPAVPMRTRCDGVGVAGGEAERACPAPRQRRQRQETKHKAKSEVFVLRPHLNASPGRPSSAASVDAGVDVTTTILTPHWRRQKMQDPPPPRRRLLPTVRRGVTRKPTHPVTPTGGDTGPSHVVGASASAASTSLLDLPVELLEHTFAALPADALAAVAATCVACRDAVADRSWRRLFELRWGAVAARTAASADDALWNLRYSAAHASDVAAAAQTATGSALSSMLAQSVVARASVAPPWPPPPLVARRVAAAPASESPAERAAAWRSATSLPPGNPPSASGHSCPATRWARLPGGPPSLHGCTACGFVHACARPACDAAVSVDAAGVDRVCPISGAVFEGDNAWRVEEGGGGGDDEDEKSEFGGRLGRAYAEGYLGAE